MMQEIKTHIFHYLILFLILGFGFWGFRHFSYQPNFQKIIILALAFLYFVWGVVHHHLEGNLKFKIMVEYASIAILAAALLIFTIGAAG